MMTDRRPGGKKKEAEYIASAKREKIRVPSSPEFIALARGVANAMAEQSYDAVNIICTDLLQALSEFYGVASPVLQILPEGRPHSTYEGRLASELFGDYDLRSGIIRLWLRTPMKQQWTSANTLVSTLCHEFMHHLDVRQLGFPNTFHTIGFFERTHRLYLAATGSPYYSLAWDLVSMDGSRRFASVVATIDWLETNRAKARAMARKVARGKRP